MDCVGEMQSQEFPIGRRELRSGANKIEGGEAAGTVKAVLQWRMQSRERAWSGYGGSLEFSHLAAELTADTSA